MHFGPNDALGASGIGPPDRDLEFYAAGLWERLLKGGGHEFVALTTNIRAHKSSVVLFCAVDERGKHQLFAHFPTGAIQILATEPDA